MVGSQVSRHLAVTALGIAGLFIVAAFALKPNWPVVSIPKYMAAAKAKGLKMLAEMPIGPIFYYYNHDPHGAYLERGKAKPCEPSETRPFDDAGVTMTFYRGEQHYHPVRTAQCGLYAYTWSLAGNDGEALVRLHADKLINMQDERGAFQYMYAWRFYLAGEDFPAGWASAMSQGQGLSLFARAYRMTGDEKYLRAGKKALAYMLTPVEQGGVMTTMAALDPSLDDFIFLEEYPSTPPNYTLNGYIFALIGLYDWSKVEAGDFGQDRAADYFKDGVATLTNILPYYDMGGITSYDLGYLTFPKPSKVSAGYHVLHVQLLHTLFEITREPKLKEYEEKWMAYLPPYSVP